MTITSRLKLLTLILLATPGLVDAAMLQKPQFEIDYTLTSNSRLEQPAVNDEFKVKELHVKGVFAKQETSFGDLIYAVDYSQHRFTLADSYTSRSLHQLALPIILVNKQQQWTIVSQIAPSINSDFEKVDGDDFTARAMLRAAYKATDSTSWVMGAAIDRSFGDSQFYPLLGVDYTPAADWEFQLVIPRPMVKYMPDPDMLVYWLAEPAGDKWNVEASNSKQSLDVTTKAIRSGVGVEINLVKGWWFKAEAGREFNREIETVNDDGSAFELDVEDTNYIKASLRYRL